MNAGEDPIPGKPPGLLEELRRRKVVRVGLAYVMASWALLQVVDVVAPILEVSDATVQVLFWLLVAGFPVAVFLAWAFELTPEGIRSTERARQEFGEAQHEASFQKRRNRLAYLSGIIGPAMLIGGGLGAAAVWTFVRPAAEQKTADVSAETWPTIAVLPFTNMSPDENNAFFAAGVHEEILTSLSRLADVKVISRTSVMNLPDEKMRIPELAELLGATHILEGSVRRAGHQVRITAQLIEADSDEHLWAGKYDEELGNIFEIQSDVAGSIAGILQTTFEGTGEGHSRVAATSNIEAYDAYLKALPRLVQTRGPDAQKYVSEGLDLLYRAVALDPNFAPAWQKIARWESRGRSTGTDTDGSRLVLAEQALDEARRLAPDATDTRLAEAWLLYWGHHRYEDALRLVQEIRRSEPNRAAPYELESLISRRLGRFDDYRVAADKVLQLDPLNSDWAFWLGHQLRDLGRYEESYQAYLASRRGGSGIDRWLELDTDIARVFVAPDYAEFSKLMNEHIAWGETGEGLFSDDRKWPIMKMVAEHMSLTGRLEVVRRLGGSWPTYSDDFRRDGLFNVSRQVATLVFLGDSDQARELSRATLQAVGEWEADSVLAATRGNLEKGHTALTKARIGAVLGEQAIADAGVSALRDLMASVEHDALSHRVATYWYIEALTATDPDKGAAVFLDNGLDLIPPHDFAVRPHLWYPLLENTGVRARFDDHPEWVQFMRDRWPESRPFPFDDDLSARAAR